MYIFYSRSEFLNQYLGVGGTNVFSKAKKSLTNSFDQFMKRRTSTNDVSSGIKPMSLPITNNLNKVGLNKFLHLNWFIINSLLAVKKPTPFSNIKLYGDSIYFPNTNIS